MRRAEDIIRENAKRNAVKSSDYDPVSGVGCLGERFRLTVADLTPYALYLPIEMVSNKSIILLRKHGSIEKALTSALKRKPTQLEKDYFWLKVCEQRYQFDFEYYSVSCSKIRDKETGQLIPFLLNRAQRKILKELEKQRLEDRQININLLKARQMGGSTLLQMYMNWIQIVLKTNWNSLVCAHDLTAATGIRSMYVEAIKEMTPVGGVKLSIKPFAGLKNIKEVAERGCRITVGTAEKPESVRSQDLKLVHFSETAFYPATDNNNPEQLEASIISAIPKVPLTMIVRESTANGVGGYFYEQYQKGKAGDTAFTSIFTPWFIIPLYEEHFVGSYYRHNGKLKKGTATEFISTMTDYEWNLWNNHEECTLENLNWRRMMAATMPSESKMKQEYPSDDIEAFQDSGSPVFKSEDIESLRKDTCPPIAVGVLDSIAPPEISILEPNRRSDILKGITFITDAESTAFVQDGDLKLRDLKGRNKLHIWQFPDTSQKISNRYVVSFDPQKGTSDSADYGVIKIFDRYWMMEGEGPEVVAMYYGRIDKDITAWMAVQIAKWYNNALLVIESNTYDSDLKEDDTEFIFNIIADYYPNLYARQSSDKVRENRPVRYGFHTGKTTKPMIINHYTALIRERAYIERDVETLNEAQVFETKKDGKTGAKQGKHDDRIMATMIGLWVCFDLPMPAIIKPPSTQLLRRTAW